LEAGKITTPGGMKELPLLEAWTNYLSWKLERLPLLEAWKDYLSWKHGRITSPGSMEGLPLLEAGKITFP
jgi:hypothetical protein